MRITIIVFLFIGSLLQINAQHNLLKYSRVKVDLRNHSISEIASLGLEADHGEYAKGKHLINDFSSLEIDQLRENGIPFDIMIDDVQAFYIERNLVEHNHDHEIKTRNLGDCNEVQTNNKYDYETPINYKEGSMGGYMTYDELLIALDDMATKYPNLISVKAPIGNTLTHEGRPIYWLRLSDNPNTDEDEPEVLYTALHHAREANSLSQMVFYLWYLLENYETDDEIKYLVDNTAMYFIPCVNPDGYVYNETTNPLGGGLWRKNKYVHNDTLWGVDLNRNYGFQWGINDVGSSPDQQSQVYRGPAAFSEPETQAVRDFCNEHQFKIALNYHSYGNLLIYPWGYNDQLTEDHSTFLAIANIISKENDFFSGTATQTVGYGVNGNSDDWMYGDVETKPAIFSLTPEVGNSNFGFWPAQNQIDQLNKSCVKQNLVTAHLILNYAEAEESVPSIFVTSKMGSVNLSVKKYGLEKGNINLTVSGLGNAQITSTNSESWDMDHLDEEEFTFDYKISDEQNSNEAVKFAIQLNNGLYTIHDTINKIYLEGEVSVELEDMGDEISNWTSEKWGETTEEFYSSQSSYTDSPFNDYQQNSETEMELNEPVHLSVANKAILNFYAKWEIEAEYDYVQVMGSGDGINFTPLCGIYTKNGTINQDPDQPVYDGYQKDWIFEEIDLEDFLGGMFYLKFRLVTDMNVNEDGFYFDDLTVRVITDINATTENSQTVSDVQIFPNPFTHGIKVNLNLFQKAEKLELQLTNALGQVFTRDTYVDLSSGNHSFPMDNSDLKAGIYFLRVLINGVYVDSQKVIKVN